jgi:hypothetical protein
MTVSRLNNGRLRLVCCCKSEAEVGGEMSGEKLFQEKREAQADVFERNRKKRQERAELPSEVKSEKEK